MPRQLTPEEIHIIRQTEQEGAELAAREEKEKGKGYVLKQRVRSIVILGVVFIIFVLIAYFVVINIR